MGSPLIVAKRAWRELKRNLVAILVMEALLIGALVAACVTGPLRQAWLWTLILYVGGGFFALAVLFIFLPTLGQNSVDLIESNDGYISPKRMLKRAEEDAKVVGRLELTTSDEGSQGGGLSLTGDKGALTAAREEPEASHEEA